MVVKIQVLSRYTNQLVSKTVGQIARCVYKSSLLKYRLAMSRLEEIQGERIDTLNIVGGTIQNQLLFQMVADAIDQKTNTGPVDGATIGNLVVQAKALVALTEFYL